MNVAVDRKIFFEPNEKEKFEKINLKIEEKKIDLKLHENRFKYF